MEYCIFCRIKESNDAFIIYESTWSIAILDIFPATKGHILVISKDHIEQLHQIENKEIQDDIFNTLVIVSKMLIDSNLCSDYHIVQSNGDLADQDIPHVHFHIIPRYPEDRVVMDLNSSAERTEEDQLIAVYTMLCSHRNFA